MTEKRYIVLRSDNRNIPSFENLGRVGGPAGAAGSSGMSAMGSQIELTEASLSKMETDDLRRDPATRAIAPAMPLALIEPQLVNEAPNPGATGVAWGIEAVGAVNTAFDGSGIVVAVLDTGIDPGHAAFEGVNLLQRNFTDGGSDDEHGHGTHCAATVFGRDVDGIRIGVARNVSRALIGKVLGEGGGSSATLANAIYWAVENGANVISMSLGIDFPGYVDWLVNQQDYPVNAATSLALEAYRANINLFGALSEMVEARNAFGHGTVIVAASGNESKRPDYEIAVAPPAAGNGIISVGALQLTATGYSVASFSNTQCNVSAPGVDISSAGLGGGLVAMSGTSMATPHVAGVAVLWAQQALEQSGFISAANVSAQILARATMQGVVAGAGMDDVGNGIVQSPN